MSRLRCFFNICQYILQISIQKLMEKQQRKQSCDLALDTGSNFFNASQDIFIQVPSDLEDRMAKYDIINEAKSSGSDFLSVPCSVQNQAYPIQTKVRGVSRFGNHRNKTSKGFERANMSIALKQKQAQSNRFFKDNLTGCLPDEKYFQSFSPGMYLFFVFLKKVGLLFFVFTILYMIPLIYNLINGEAFSYSSSTFQLTVAKTMLGNQVASLSWDETIKDKLLIVLPDTISAVIMFLFILYWSSFSEVKTKKLKETFKQASDTTIQVTQFAPQLTEIDIQEYFKKYGLIREIAAVKNYEQMIDLSKQVFQLSLQIKQKMIMSIKQKNKLDQQYLNKKQTKMNELLDKLDTTEKKREKKNIKFYIRFEQEESKRKVLEDFEPYYSFFRCCSKNPPEQLKIKEKFPRIRSCLTEPGEIIWQNMHITYKSRWIRFLLQCILIIVIIVLGFIFISFLNISTPPTTYKNIETESLTFENVKQLNSTQISYTWCVNKDSASFTAEEKTFCQSFIDNYKLRIFLSVGITVIIIIVKLILKYIMIKIAHFQRYKHHTQLSTNIMTNLFIIYITTTVMITFLLQANIFGIAFKNFMTFFVKDEQLLDNMDNLQEYQDFIPYWYKDIGYQIWMNWLILSLFPHILMPLYHFLREKVYYKFAQKEILQKNVKNWIQSQQFQIQDNYADILMLIFVGFGFAGGIPFLVFLTFIGLITRMIYVKYTFVRFCKIPKYYTEAMNQRVKLILQISLVFHMGISIWMYGVSDIFTNFEQFQIFKDVSNYSSWLATIGIKLAENWYLSIILASFIAGFICFRVMMELFKKLCARENKVQEENPKNQQTDPQFFEANNKLKITQKALTDSYKIQKNPNYFEILAIMKPEQAQQFLHQTMAIPFFNLRISKDPRV